MKNRLLSLAATLLITCSLFCNSIVTVNAEETSDRKVDGSYLTTEESSTAEIEYNPLLRGEHLMDGTITISKAGIKKVFVYASTTADHVVDYVAVDVFVDEYNPDDDTWEQIDYWVTEAEDTYYVATQKTVYVDGGHYYRVRGSHYAGNEEDSMYDESATLTDGIWVD